MEISRSSSRTNLEMERQEVGAVFESFDELALLKAIAVIDARRVHDTLQLPYLSHDVRICLHCAPNTTPNERSKQSSSNLRSPILLSHRQSLKLLVHVGAVSLDAALPGPMLHPG